MKSIESIPTAELTEIINAYPWFSAARVELCKRQFRTGEAAFDEVALYIGSRELLYELANEEGRCVSRDSDVADVIREAPNRKVKVVGGDFFSQDQYDTVRKDSDYAISKAVSKVQGEKSEPADDDMMMAFCTETLAQIYAEQGYYQQAKNIYSKLMLRYPEKNVYFATLIENLEKIEKINKI